MLIRNATECRNAFALAADNGDILTLSLPENAVGYMGLLYIHSMLEESHTQYPTVRYNFICDCGEDAALVQEAFRIGFRHVAYKGSAETFSKLETIAAYYKGTLAT